MLPGEERGGAGSGYPQEVGGVGDGGRWCHGRLTGSRGRVGPGRWVAYNAAVVEAVSGKKQNKEKDKGGKLKMDERVTGK